MHTMIRQNDVPELSLFDAEPPEREPRAHARRTDPQTSHDAAASIAADQLRDSQRAVLDVLRHHGPIDDHTLEGIYGMLDQLPPQSVSGLRTRRRELVERGLVADTGERVKLPSGRTAIVWKAVDA